MTQPRTAPYGTWASPLTAARIVVSNIGLGGVAWGGDRLCWLESRPTEGGRTVLVERTAAGPEIDITPAGFNIRTRVHEYGGGALLLTEAAVYFVNFADQRLYRQRFGEAPEALSAEGPYRYADLVLDRGRDRLLCVCEDHSQPGAEPTNTLVSLDLATGTRQTLVSGSDFYSSPRLSPEGKHLAWLSWNHPQMPWDGTQLWVARLEADGSLGPAVCLAGGEQESICAPTWSPEGWLYFVSDRSNWWNLYRANDLTGKTEASEPLFPLAAEFAFPHWVFGLQPYLFESPNSILCTYSQNGRTYLARLDIAAKHLQPFELPFTSISSLSLRDGQAYFVGGSPTEPTRLVQVDLDTLAITTLKWASDLALEPGYLSQPQAIAFPTADGQTAYAWFYPPQNQDFQAPPDERPPLIVRSHGGPTAAAAATLNLRYQYWTSRGFALLDVNYGGSSGYGRAYRQRLQGQWGVVDVADCVQGARYLVEQGWVDGERLAIAGGSAGGYTTLAALTFHNVFKAGASYYGVSDLAILAQDTHKFEARYLDGLIGPYPEAADLYRARSPLHHSDRLTCPVIFFQGLEDKIVPPNQAEMLVAALQAKGIPVAYVAFADEQHGFRRAETIQRALEGEFYFYARIFGFEPAEALTPVEILNL